MKKYIIPIIVVVILLFFYVSNSNIEKEEIIKSGVDENSISTVNETNLSVPEPVLSISERNEKLINAIKSTEGTLDADVSKDILTVQVLSVEPEEAQKIAEGILNQIKKYKENEHIKTVMVCDINYKLLGYAGEKK